MKNVLVVSNFNAGRKKSVKYKKTVHKFLLTDADFFKFISVDELENQNMKSFDTVIVMGGDGTINKVLPFIGDKTLGIIPCGTANLLSAKLGIPDNINKAVKVIKQGYITPVDIMNVNGKPCILRCGIGYDSNIICHTPQSLKNKFGYFAYFAAGILFALRLKNKEYGIEYDNKKNSINASCIIIANAANMFRNIFAVGNKSKLDDGLFEVFILKTQNPILFFIEFLLILLNIRHNSSRAAYFKANNIYLKAKYFKYHIDGEEDSAKDELSCKFSTDNVKIFSKNVS